VRKHKYMPLSSVREYEAEMKSQGVSEVARSPRGFLTQYKRVKGDGARLNEHWRAKREAFIARHMAQYEKNPTRRRKLALIAWAYKPPD